MVIGSILRGLLKRNFSPKSWKKCVLDFAISRSSWSSCDLDLRSPSVVWLQSHPVTLNLSQSHHQLQDFACLLRFLKTAFFEVSSCTPSLFFSGTAWDRNTILFVLHSKLNFPEYYREVSHILISQNSWSTQCSAENQNCEPYPIYHWSDHVTPK